MYEFLSRLHLEFKPRQLFAQGCVPLSNVLSELRDEDTRLRGAGLFGVPSTLVARASGPSRPGAPPLLPGPFGGARLSRGGSRSHPLLHYGHCQKLGHPESDFYKKMLDMGVGNHDSSTVARSPPSSPSLFAQDIVMSKRIIVASGLLRRKLLAQ
jgi:hypothetical protein